MRKDIHAQLREGGGAGVAVAGRWGGNRIQSASRHRGWSPGGAGGAIANGGSGSEGGSGRGGSGGTRPCIALSARALFQELGVPMAAWHHSRLAVRYPRLGLDYTMGQRTVIMGGLDDVIVNDVDINNADVAGRRRRIHWLELQSLP